MMWLSLGTLQCVSNRDLMVIFIRTHGHGALIEVCGLELMDFSDFYSLIMVCYFNGIQALQKKVHHY